MSNTEKNKEVIKRKNAKKVVTEDSIEASRIWEDEGPSITVKGKEIRNLSPSLVELSKLDSLTREMFPLYNDMASIKAEALFYKEDERDSIARNKLQSSAALALSLVFREYMKFLMKPLVHPPVFNDEEEEDDDDIENEDDNNEEEEEDDQEMSIEDGSDNDE